MSNDPIRCRHIHTEGRQCGSPALRGEKLCYHHHAARRPLARRPGGLIRPHLPHPEDLHAVQSGIAELLRLISIDQLDAQQAKLLLGTLTLASANLARIERNRRNTRTLALAEAKFAAKHPESNFFVCHSRGESASTPADETISPEPESPTAATAAPRLKWDQNHDEPPVTDLVHDPELGSIAPGPDPEPRPEGPLPQPTPLLTPAAPGITPEENLANWNRAIAQLKPETLDLDAAGSSHLTRRSPRNSLRMLDQTTKTRKPRVISSVKAANPLALSPTPSPRSHPW